MRARGIWLLAAFLTLFFPFVISRATTASPDPSARDSFTSRAVSQRQGLVAVRVAVLTDHESQQYFGVALADEGIQAVWLSVENGSDATLHYLSVTTDSNYFTAPEVARLFHGWWPSETNTKLDALFVREAMPDAVAPHQTAAGFVLTHREGGLKFLRVGFIGASRQFDFRSCCRSIA